MTVAVLTLAVTAVLADCNALELRGSPEAVACYREAARVAEDSAVQAEALWRAGDVAGANAAFRDAVGATPDDATVRARWGRLFIDVHQEADAEALFQQALSLDENNVEALIGLAELALGRFEPGVRSRVARVLRRRPDHPEAHLLLARMHLELGDGRRVRADLEGLIERGVLEGVHELDAYALLAAADALEDRQPSPWVERALAINPRFADVHAVPARHYVINRRYREAVARYRQAVQVDPGAWDAHAELGINLLRVNEIDAARRHLERAYEGDPYNALTVNTLRLLDLLAEFAVVQEPGVLMRAPAGQAAALFPHVRLLAKRARAGMADRYGYVPEGPVVVELYEHHDDFAVRTAGLPGLGILGATFGDVVVMDGPAAKGIEEGFDWASALWHELAHVYTLGATGNRVSRWFSEGVSVMEEWRHGPTPQHSVPLQFLQAVADGRLLGVDELDEGFLRPKFPEQISISYVQAGLVCELIAERFDTGLADMLRAYRAGKTTTEAVQQALGVAPEALDEALAEHIDARFDHVLPSLEALRASLEEAHRAVADEDWPAAMEAARRAVALYPEYVQPDGAYVPLARAAGELGEHALREETLKTYFARGGRDPWALKELAGRLEEAGAVEQELAVWRALVRTVPLDGGLLGRYGARLAVTGQHPEALEAHRAALALGTHDEAGTRLAIARSLLTLGRTEEARRTLLTALEIAPRYDAALDLLLKINTEDRHHE